MNSVAAFYPAPQLNERLAVAAMHASPTLRLTAVRNGYAVLLCVGGEIDAANAYAWETALDEVASATDPQGFLLIDARDVNFLGLPAYAALAKQSLRCRRRGVELRLISTRPIVARIIAACDLRDAVPICSSVDAALELRQHGRRRQPITRVIARQRRSTNADSQR